LGAEETLFLFNVNYMFYMCLFAQFAQKLEIVCCLLLKNAFLEFEVLKFTARFEAGTVYQHGIK